MILVAALLVTGTPDVVGFASEGTQEQVTAAEGAFYHNSFDDSVMCGSSGGGKNNRFCRTYDSTDDKAVCRHRLQAGNSA